MILGRENITGSPADLGAKGNEGFDQNGGLNGHMQGTGNACSGQRLPGSVLFAYCHQARHLNLGHFNFLAAPVSQSQILHLVIIHFC